MVRTRRKLSSEDYPWGVSPEQLQLFQPSFDSAWATGRWWDIVNPDLEVDPATREAWARYLRASASPGMARDLLAQNAKLDVRDLLSMIDVPTLVIHRSDDRWAARAREDRRRSPQSPGARDRAARGGRRVDAFDRPPPIRQ
jgi:pimeloyl-ACP methyl ester carboxylesterase